MAGVQLISVSPSSREKDIFGKELSLSGSEEKILSGAGDVFLCKRVQVENHSKKGDSTEPRLLVITSSRCYILIQNPTSKLDTSFNFLKLQQLKCSEEKLSVHLSGEIRPREFLASRRDSVEIISLITAQLKNVFPLTPLELILKLTYDPDILCKEVNMLCDELLGGMERVNASSMQGFLTIYAFLCDFFGVKYNAELSWYMRHVYMAHGLRDIVWADFDNYSTKEFLPVVSSLQYSSFFEGVVARDVKLLGEVVAELCLVLRSSHALKTLVLSNCGLKQDQMIHIVSSLTYNARAVLTHLDLSDNTLDDKVVEALAGALECLPHGLHQLKLANCKISAKSNSMLANSLKQNKHMQYSLVHLDLSGNLLGPDPLGGLCFLQEPQTLATLKLARCNLLLDTVVPVLIRGCTQHLCELDLSNNSSKAKKAAGHTASVGSGLQKFCGSSISLRFIKLAGCKLTCHIVTSLLIGLGDNPNVTTVSLDVSSNELCGQGLPTLLEQVQAVTCLHDLNLSDTQLDPYLVDVITAVAHNKKLRHLKLGKNFGGKANTRLAAAQALAEVLRKEDCRLLSLGMEDSHLKDLTPVIVSALADNTSLAKINLCGNQMGQRGASALAKALLSNCSLTEVLWDHNEMTARGFQEIAAALEHNYTLRVMPLPLYDIGRIGIGVEEHVQSIQRYLCRNHSDERLKVEMAARHRSRLLSATQQSSVVGRELVQLEDLLQWAESSSSSHPLVEKGRLVKELANNTIKLTDGLYSPQVESEQFQTITRQVREVVDQLMEKLFLDHIEDQTMKMVCKSKHICGSALSEEACEKLEGLVVHGRSREFSQSKKDVLRHALPEIVNHVSDTNVEVAAEISELLVEHTLASLDNINSKLLLLQNEKRIASKQATDSKVSRKFTFKVQDDTPSSGGKRRRVRRPDPEDGDDDEIDLPSIPLKMTGPALQHLGKGRPKPARMQRSRPTRNTSSQPAPNTGPEINTAPEGPSTTPPLSPRSPKTPLSPTPLAAMKPRASIIKMPPPPKAKPSKEDEMTSQEEKQEVKSQNAGPGVNTPPEGPSPLPPLSPRSPKTPLSPTPPAAMKPQASPKAKPSKEEEMTSQEEKQEVKNQNAGPEVNTPPEGPSPLPPLSPKTPLSPTPPAAMKPQASPKAKPSKEEEMVSQEEKRTGQCRALKEQAEVCNSNGLPDLKEIKGAGTSEDEDERGETKSPSAEWSTSDECEEHRTVQQRPLESSPLDEINEEKIDSSVAIQTVLDANPCENNSSSSTSVPTQELNKPQLPSPPPGQNSELEEESGSAHEPVVANGEGKKEVSVLRARFATESKKTISFKEKGSNLSKVLFYSKSVGALLNPVGESPAGLPATSSQSSESDMFSSEWEVLDGAELAVNGNHVSPEGTKKPPPVIKEKPPPVIKEKPRKPVEPPLSKETAVEGGESKKVPILPSSKISSLSSIQKGAVKVEQTIPVPEGMDSDSSSASGKLKNAKPSPGEDTDRPTSQASPLLPPIPKSKVADMKKDSPRSIPSPAAKPKPSVRVKKNRDASKISKTTIPK